MREENMCILRKFILAYFCVPLIVRAQINYTNTLLKTDLPDIVPRSDWHARPPTAIENMTNPVSYVVIHHSYQPSACYSFEECSQAMRWMQDYHQYDHGWNDIAYSFAVGSDGRAYEGRGWSAVGAHAPKYNNISIGICLIGDWREKLPPAQQLETVKQLIYLGVKKEKITGDYKLIGHKQVRDTECPGTALYREICGWPHHCDDPDPNTMAHEQIHNHSNKNI